jgi:hypothetical protein
MRELYEREIESALWSSLITDASMDFEAKRAARFFLSAMTEIYFQIGEDIFSLLRIQNCFKSLIL